MVVLKTIFKIGSYSSIVRTIGTFENIDIACLHLFKIRNYVKLSPSARVFFPEAIAEGKNLSRALVSSQLHKILDTVLFFAEKLKKTYSN
jgi:hypothetical protein